MAGKEPRALVAGNWKMNGLMKACSEAEKLVAMLSDMQPGCEIAICPPATLLSTLAPLVAQSRIRIGGQDCHSEESGAHTGDISAEMLADAGCSLVIVGHSERRADHGESSAAVRGKALAAHRAGLTAIVCVGETAAERRAGETLAVITSQLAESLPDTVTAEDTVVAYEPVWAIGTGDTATPGQVAEVHEQIRGQLVDRFGEATGAAITIQYGGSVKPANAAELMAIDNVNGALVGGASLKAADFFGIVSAYS